MMQPPMPSDAAAAAGLLGLLAGFAIVGLVIALVWWVFWAVCLQTIATKLGDEPTWLGWIPIFGLVLGPVRYANLPMWWALVAILGYLLPVINQIWGLVVCVFFGWCFYRIAERRGKPGWIGAVTCVPLIGWIVPAYLAFAD